MCPRQESVNGTLPTCKEARRQAAHAVLKGPAINILPPIRNASPFRELGGIRPVADSNSEIADSVHSRQHGTTPKISLVAGARANGATTETSIALRSKSLAALLTTSVARQGCALPQQDTCGRIRTSKSRRERRA